MAALEPLAAARLAATKRAVDTVWPAEAMAA
jgi:hypothetical protein